ncbi:MAG: acetylglutamate kinase [Chloroflexota bacterium]
MEFPIEPSTQPSEGTVQLPERIVLRLATPQDIPAIMRIHNQGIEDRIATVDSQLHTPEEQWEWYHNHGPSEPIIVAECEGNTIGWAALSRFSQRKTYQGIKELSIYIERQWRGKGVGTMMLERLIEIAHGLGIYKIVLNALPVNQGAIALYRKFGFRTVGTWQGQGKIDDQWVDMVLMEKHLSHPARDTTRKGPLGSPKSAGGQSIEPASSGIVVVKIGGSTLGSHDTTLEDLASLQKQGSSLVVVHGGGKIITDWMGKQGIRPLFVRGLRVTDAPSLDIVVAVLAGLINKALVAQLLVLGARAIGISGVDGGLLQAKVTDPELGLVGQIVRVNPGPLHQILNAGSIPVIAPLALQLGDRPGQGGILLNVNADAAAGEIAATLGARKLIFLTDVPGIMDSSRRVIPKLTRRRAQDLLASGIVTGGMIPKLEACLNALDKIGSAQIVDGRRPRALMDSLEDRAPGTRIG